MHVYPVKPVELHDVSIPNGTTLKLTATVHEDIESIVSVCDGIGKISDTAVVGQVEPAHGGSATQTADVGLQRLQRIQRPSGQDDLDAGRSESKGYRPTDALACACYDSDFRAGFRQFRLL
jgi:hypothetical protein